MSLRARFVLAACALVVASGCGTQGSALLVSLTAFILFLAGCNTPTAPESPDGSSPKADAASSRDASQPTVDASQPTTTDAGQPAVDAGEPATDAGQPAVDASEPTADAGQPSPDAGQPIADAGSAGLDASHPALDAGQPGLDAGAPPAPPETTITSAPAAMTSDLAPSFAFGSPQAPVTFECKMDAEAFAACTSPKSYAGLTDGSHEFQVRAVNAGGPDATPAAYTFQLDTTAPTSTVTLPASPAKTGPTTIQGTAIDAVSGLAEVSVLVRRNSDSQYWTGSAWVAAETWLAVTGLETWTTPAPTWSAGIQYVIESRAEDLVGNVETRKPGKVFAIDNLPPTFAGITSARFSFGDKALVSWLPASDNVTLPGAMRYDVCVSATSGGCAADFVVAGTSQPGASSEEISLTNDTVPVTPNTPLYFVARARDEAGNVDANTAEAVINHATLMLQSGNPGEFTTYLAFSPYDEFVRYTDVVDFQVPVWMLWEMLYPNDAMPSDDARLKQLHVTLTAKLRGAAAGSDTITVPQTGFSGAQYSLMANIGGVRMSEFAHDLDAELLIMDVPAGLDAGVFPSSDAGFPSITIPLDSVRDFPVFGGDPAIRNVLLDNTVSGKRERIIERDGLFQQSLLTLGLSDWRADQVVDKTSLNLQIGTAQFSGRMGYYEAPIYGQLIYQVWLGYSEDNGQSFQELAATPNTASRLLGAGRTDYELQLTLGANTTKLLVYAHVKAVLIADYSQYANIKTKWYSDGQQVLLKEAWDNPNGANTNYEFPVSPKP
ncbi:MAG: hypothetical protein QM765_42835 [Myxococcales bacterium]